MRGIKAAGSEVLSKFIFSEVVGKLIDYLLLFLLSLRKPDRGKHAAPALLLRFEGAKMGKIPRAWVSLCFN